MEAKKPKRRPTPNKRSSVVEDKIVDSVKDGATLEGAVLSHGIHPVTFLRWRRCKKDDTDTSARDDRCWNCRNCRLQEKVDGALESYKCVLLQRIQSAKDKSGLPVWQASAWLLERRFRDEFSLKTIMDQHHSHALEEGNKNAQKLVSAIIGAAQEATE